MPEKEVFCGLLVLAATKVKRNVSSLVGIGIIGRVKEQFLKDIFTGLLVL
jgi:hypothetical protein